MVEIKEPFPVGNGYRVYKSRRTGEKWGVCFVLLLFFTTSLQINGTSACRAGLLPFIDFRVFFSFLMGDTSPPSKVARRQRPSCGVLRCSPAAAPSRGAGRGWGAASLPRSPRLPAAGSRAVPQTSPHFGKSVPDN